MRWNGQGGQAPRLLVADRSPVVAAGMAAYLRECGYDSVAQSNTAAHTELVLAGGTIDAAVVDVQLSGSNTLDMLDRLRARGMRVPIVITAADAGDPLLAAVIESSADGLVLKSEVPDNLLHCLAAVTAGKQWFDAVAIASAVDRVEAAGGAATLTRRERDVTRLVVAGKRNRGIAAQLGISEGTVKMHLHHVYAKLGIESRTQLAMDERLRETA